MLEEEAAGGRAVASPVASAGTPRHVVVTLDPSGEVRVEVHGTWRVEVSSTEGG
jgi:hypothetical protein